MSEQFNLPAAFKKNEVSAAVKALNMESAGDGIEASFGVVKIAGKVWSLQYKGQNYPFMRADGDGPKGFIDVVFVKMAKTKSKTYYEGGWKAGSKDRPTCSSNDAVRPDPSIVVPQHSNCALCPKNKVGSATTDTGKPAKACSDHKRTAVFLDPKTVEEAMGDKFLEPVMLRIPAGSLNDFDAFGTNMEGQGFPMISFITRIGFNPSVNYQKLVFTAHRPLNEGEQAFAVELRGNVVTDKILYGVIEVAPAEEPKDNAFAKAAAQANTGTVVPLKPASKPEPVAAKPEPVEETSSFCPPARPPAKAPVPLQQLELQAQHVDLTPTAQAQEAQEGDAPVDPDTEDEINKKLAALLGT